MLKTVLVGGFLAATLAAANAAPITYDVDLSNGKGVSAIGTITTDGTIGNLAASDILSWSFDLTGFGLTFTDSSTSNAALAYFSVGSLTASASELTFTSVGQVNFQGNGDDLSFQPLNGTAGIFDVFYQGYSAGYGTLTSPAIATVAATPLPASWAMMLPVFAFGGLMLYRRKNAMGV